MTQNSLRKVPKLLLAMPLPPPFSGQEMITQMLLASPLSDHFQIIHLDTSNKTNNVNRGRLDWQNSLATVKSIVNLFWLLWRERPNLSNIPMPKNRFGFIKFATLVLPCAWFGAKVVSRSGGGHFDKFYENEPDWMQAFIRYTLKHIDAVIVRADCLRYPFEPFFADEKIWTVYLGLDPYMFDSTLESREASRQNVNVLYVGHLSKAKGGLDLLAAIPKVLAQYPDTRFHLAGDILKRERNITFIDNPDDIETEIYNLINEEGIQDAIDLLGIIVGDAKINAFSNADIFVLPSYAEGFPFAVLEAMLAGAAVVTTPVGALPEVFEHEKHLLFVEPGDVNGIALAINRLIEDTSLRIELGNCARQTVQQRFNLQILADQMEKVFTSTFEKKNL